MATMAELRGWARVAAIQVEYNLLQRTVEGEQFGAARELGLGLTTWSPLSSGVLRGKYTREHQARGIRPGLARRPPHERGDLRRPGHTASYQPGPGNPDGGGRPGLDPPAARGTRHHRRRPNRRPADGGPGLTATINGVQSAEFGH
jgi:hypothetical protein